MPLILLPILVAVVGFTHQATLKYLNTRAEINELKRKVEELEAKGN
jgi:BMFP domain-containing protein YqiC